MSAVFSPIDGAPMRKLKRYGVEIDVCERSGGVWLDKGELEKIVGLVREDCDRNGRRARADDHDDEHGSDHDDEDDLPARRGKRRRRSGFLDMFDV